MSLTANIENEPFSINSSGDRYLYSVNRKQFQGKDSKALYAEKFSEILYKEDQLSVIVGTDSGMLPQYLNEKSLPIGARILFLELPQIYNRLLADGYFEGLSEKIICKPYSLLSVQANDDSLGLDEYLYIDQVKQYLSLGAAADYISGYQELSLLVQERLLKERKKVAASLRHEAFIVSQLKNVADNLQPVDCFKGMFPEKTAVVLGGGPSLDDILPWLKNNRKKVVVIAVSRISQKLCEEGISPDFIVTIDPQDVSFDVSREMFLLDPAPVLIYANHANLSIIGQWPAHKFYCGHRLPWDSPLNICAVPVTGPTVTNQALAIAQEMGFSQVLLAGVDLCFDKSGFSHASGSYERESGPSFAGQDFWVETYGRQMAVTNVNFEQAIEPLSVTAEMAVARGCRVVNVSPGAAKVNFIEHVPIDQVSIVGLEDPARKSIEKIVDFNNNSEGKILFSDIKNDLLEVKGSVIKIKNLSKKALSYNKNLKFRNENEINKYINKIENEINKNHKKASFFIKNVGISKFLPVIKFKNNYENLERSEEIRSIYYSAYYETSCILIKIIDDSLSRLSSREDELSENPDIDSIITQWAFDKTPGRIRIYKKKWLEIIDKYPVDTLKKIKKADEEFDGAISRANRELSNKRKAHSNPEIAFKKARIFYGKNNKSGLIQLITGLSYFDEKEALEVKLIIQGLLAELEENLELAAQHYSEAVELSPSVKYLEDLLQRIAVVSLKLDDMENALIALECLSSIAPLYLGQYANLLKSLGDIEKAVEVYADYLDNFPEDIDVMLTLARIYKEQGLEEGVEVMCQLVLEKQPQNNVAMDLLGLKVRNCR